MSLKSSDYDFDGMEVEIGIDEAGRGPVLGPMVYGCAFWPADPNGNTKHSKEMKAKFGFADSKQLKEEDRELIFKRMKEAHHKEIGFFADVIDATTLSQNMLADWDKGGRNLNKISHDSAIMLIKKVRDTLGFTVKRVFLDTVGDPKKYKTIIENALGNGPEEITVESKADDTYPVVSAASICAKVTRDHALEDYVFPEKDLEISREFGCGYPGDKTTKAWLTDHMDSVFGFPSIVRFSWKTSYEKLAKDGKKF